MDESQLVQSVLAIVEEKNSKTEKFPNLKHKMNAFAWNKII